MKINVWAVSNATEKILDIFMSRMDAAEYVLDNEDGTCYVLYLGLFETTEPWLDFDL